MPANSSTRIIVMKKSKKDEEKPAEKEPVDVPAEDETISDVPIYEEKDYWTDPNGNTYNAANLKGMLFWNYYVCYLSLFMHLSIHALFLGMWCDYSKIIGFYSFQVVLLHAYSWAIPDRRYASWVKGMTRWFYGLSFLNIMFFMTGVFGGLYYYAASHDGIKQFMGISIASYFIMSQGLMMGMFAVNYYTLSHRWDYESNPYPGPTDFKPKKRDNEIDETDQNLIVTLV